MEMSFRFRRLILLNHRQDLLQRSPGSFMGLAPFWSTQASAATLRCLDFSEGRFLGFLPADLNRLRNEEPRVRENPCGWGFGTRCQSVGLETCKLFAASGFSAVTPFPTAHIHVYQSEFVPSKPDTSSRASILMFQFAQ